MAATEGCGAGAEAGGSRGKSVELEKYKRRLIRAVARMIKEKKPDIWGEMKKEMGSKSPETLWDKMQMVTLKKLQRLIRADDRIALIGPSARMTITDWLLFDLVIVHQKIDVIGRGKLNEDYNSRVLSNLFSLVQRFDIEGKSGDELAEAWTAATIYYNSKGHQCSPMILQRRWFQIKELTRHKFYKFWFNYRGNQRQLITAMNDSPDKLQKAIALRYPSVITHKFLSWEEAIENRLVILTDELGIKMRKVIAAKPTETTAPDVVLIEPQIEVIDLGENSDSGDEEVQNEVGQTESAPLVKIKKEPKDVGDELEEEHEVYYPPEKGIELDEEIERLEKEQETVDEEIISENDVEKSKDVIIDPVPSIDEPEADAKETNEGESDLNHENNDDCNSAENNEETIVIDDEDESQGDASSVNVENLDSSVVSNDQESNGVIAEIASVASAGIKVENLDDVIEKVITPSSIESSIDPTPGYVSDELLPVISAVSSAGVKVERDLSVLNNTVDSDMPMDNDEAIDSDMPVTSTLSSKGVNVEIEADHIEENLQTEVPSGDTEQNSNVDDVVDDVNKPIDSPVVQKDDPKVIDLDEFGDIQNLNFADEGIDFADDGIVYVEEDEGTIATVKDPQDESARNGEIKGEEIEDEDSIEEEEHTQKFDLKLLMYPVVYTTKLDDTSVFDDPSHYNQVYNKESIEKIYTLSKPVSKQSVAMSEHAIKQEQKDEKTKQLEKDNNAVSVSDDDLFRNESIEESNDESNDSDSESDVIDDTKRVKLTSYMLRKPIHRSYNPVLLCKNPDFNTRLKKLTVGFFMSARNRTLLQSCIPMTIDMSKAFEDKLIDGTLYLKPTPIDETATINLADDVETTSAALVKPTTVQQSLMSIDDTLENELKKCMAERVRGINLPDISQVRRLNQHLLTAEVTPLRLQNEATPDINKQSTIKIVPDHYVRNIKDDINNLLSEQTVKEVSNSDSNIDPVITETQPSPPLLVATKTVRIAPRPPPMVTINSPVPIVQPTPMPTQQLNTSNDTNVATNVPKVRKPIRKTVYPPIAWNKRPIFAKQTNQEPHQSDALLTIDTLYKMLSALDPSTKLAAEPKKKAIKKKVEPKPTNEETLTQIIDITNDEDQPKKVKKRSRCKIRTKDAEYCCWCSYRIDSIQSNKSCFVMRRHRCKQDQCECCCKALYYDGDLATVAAANSIEFEQKEQHISQTIEHVVQLVNQIKVDKPMSDVSLQTSLDNDTQVEPVSDTSSSNTAVLLKTTDTTPAADETTLDISKDGSAELTPLHPLPSKQPTPKIRVYSSSSKLGVSSNEQKVTNTGPKVSIIPHRNDKPVLVNQTHFGNSENTYHSQTNKETKSKPHSIQYIPCSCTRPNISKVKQGKIEINGKNSCPIHKRKKKESRIILSKKLITNDNQPFFVGKGKILLTNIKMPKNHPIVIAPTVLPPAVPICEPAPVQAISLPAGVQVVLLPDQTLTYILQPDVTLTSEEIAILPPFLAAIQQEINAVGITLPADHATHTSKIDKDESQNKKEQETKENSTEENEDFEMSIDLLSASKKVTLATSTTSAIGTPEKLEIVTNASAGKNNYVSDKDVSLETNSDSKSDHADEVTNKKSLLSDLMEMSGIMEEDLAPSQATTPPQPILLDTQNFVLHKEVPCEKKVTQTCEPSPSPTATKQYTATNKDGTFELTAVTSFKELKYSCDNNGIFFKLNLDSGQLTSINVCIQRYLNKPRAISAEKSIIDLTDDPDISITRSTDDGAVSSISNQHSVDTLNETIKQSPGYKIQISTILQKKQRLMERLSNNLKPVNILQSKKHVARILKRNKTLHRDPQFTFYSKRKLDKIEAKIDLVDSDAPMEEEYLLSDESSDDEPLIKKVKRKHLQIAGRSSETEVDKQATAGEPVLSDGQSQPTVLRDSSGQEQQLNVGDQSCEPEQSNVEKNSGVPKEVQDKIDEEKQLNVEESLDEELLVEQVLDEQEDDSIDQEDEEMNDISQTIDTMRPVPTNLVLSGGALNVHNIPLNTTYMANGDDSQDEDCILGV